ncbi:MAG: hydroxymethylpyrimidine pyrophosphatase-like HAD family hydrolase [Lentimonas sp.]|jgi:hydroxymethylpyrimidine pyrophosphatase-like HAD family hydrolase
MQTAGLKIIFQDIDGCLNPTDGEHFSVIADEMPSPNQASMLDAINQAVEASPIEHFIINSGRPLSMVRPILTHLPTSKARYVLLEHACVLFDRQTDSYLDCAQLAAQCELSDLAARYSRVQNIHRLFEWYRAHGQNALEAYYQCPLPALDKVGNLSFYIPNHVNGDELLHRIEALARAQLAPKHQAHIQFLRSDRYIDILPGIHKLDGIHLLTAHLKMDLDHALAVGDFLNDLPVFEEFHRVLCPSNAHPRIKALTQAKGSKGHVSEKAYGLALLDFLEKL